MPSSSSLVPQIPTNEQNQKQEETPKLRPHLFPTHLDVPGTSSTARTLCEILTRASPQDVENALVGSGIVPTPEIVQEVLKLSYNSPSSAIKFFRWAGHGQNHSAYAWNLMVDLLGKNQLFEPMWDAIRSMKQEGVLSMAAFVSVFGSYCQAHRFHEAIMSFEVMEKYGIQQDVVAVNSLLSAICLEDSQTSRALEFFDRIKTKIPPDVDTFAILLEGWEKEANVDKAKGTFGEMVVRIGWSPLNVSAYETFLTTLLRRSQADDAIKFLQVMKTHKCLPGLKFFYNALDIFVKQNDSTHVVPMYDIMVNSGLLPNLIMYNAAIGLLCDNNDIHNAFQFLDDMVLHAAFPDSLTYNMIFHCLIKNKKVHQVGVFFYEMIKNEQPPTHTNCAAAIAMLLEEEDPEMAIEIWDYMVNNRVTPLELSANELLVGLLKLGRLSEVNRFADDILDRKISIDESTMEKLKTQFYKEGRSMRDKFDNLWRRWSAL